MVGTETKRVEIGKQEEGSQSGGWRSYQDAGLLMLSNPYPGEKHGKASGFIGIKNRTHRTKNEKEGEKEEHPACEKVSEVERHQGITMVIEFKSTSF